MATALFSSIAATMMPFDLQNLEGFPFTTYQDQLALYSILEDWYNGVPLQAITVDSKTGKPVEKFPIKINPIQGTCHKHATTVMGQNIDSIRFGGLPFQLLPDLKEDQKEKGEVIKNALMKCFVKNALGASYVSNLIVSQYLGGSILAAKWLPGKNFIQISTPNPKEFVGIPDGPDYWNLKEAWIVKEITEETAKSYGHEPGFMENKFWYLEHWTQTEYKIMINGKTLKFPDTNLPQEGENPFGIVPIIYIPHIRTTSFIGNSIITDTVKGVIKELNLRMADMGDAVSDDSHNFIAVRHIRGAIQNMSVGDGRPVLNLGGGSGIGNESNPDMFSVATKSASEPMLKFNEELTKIYRRETNHPAVADGEDEGSQRSSLTLSTRMAPLVSEAETERVFQTIGLTKFAEILLIMMAEKGLSGITKDMLETEFIVQWQSMLPRDREALVNEAAVRAKNKLGSIEHIMTLFGDIQNPETEMEKIKKEKELTAPTPAFGNSAPKQPASTGEKTNASQSNK